MSATAAASGDATSGTTAKTNGPDKTTPEGKSISHISPDKQNIPPAKGWHKGTNRWRTYGEWRLGRFSHPRAINQVTYYLIKNKNVQDSQCFALRLRDGLAVVVGCFYRPLLRGFRWNSWCSLLMRRKEPREMGMWFLGRRVNGRDRAYVAAANVPQKLCPWV